MLPVLHNAVGGLISSVALASVALLVTFVRPVRDAISFPIPLWIGVLVFMIAVTVTVIFSRRLRATNNYLKELEAESARNLKMGEITSTDPESGVMGVFPKLPIDQLEREIYSAHEVCILQTWSDNILLLQPAIRNAARAHGRIRLLLIDPNSIMLKYRAREYRDGSFSVRELRKRVRDQIHEMKVYCQSEGISACVDIRTYDGTPVIAIYKVDDIVYIGMFWRTGSAMQCPQIKAAGKTGYYVQWAERHFESIWGDSNTHPA